MTLGWPSFPESRWWSGREMSRGIEFKYIEHVMIKFPRMRVAKVTPQKISKGIVGQKLESRPFWVVVSGYPWAFQQLSMICFILRRLSRRCTIASCTSPGSASSTDVVHPAVGNSGNGHKTGLSNVRRVGNALACLLAWLFSYLYVYWHLHFEWYVTSLYVCVLILCPYIYKHIHVQIDAYIYIHLYLYTINILCMRNQRMNVDILCVCIYIYNINICILRCICMILYYMHRFLRPCMNMNMRPPQDVHFPLQI
jgi:hypothetical protein